VPDGASLKIIDVTDEFALVRMTAKGGGEGWIRIEHLRPKVGKGRVRMGKRRASKVDATSTDPT